MKKKILLFILIIVVLTGCSNKEVTKEKEVYNSYISILDNINESSEKYPFNIEVRFDKLTEKIVRYQIIIDNVKENIYNIEAVAVHNIKTDDIFPSIGIFDEKENLEVGKKPSGIILVGYIDTEKEINDLNCKIKVLVKYEQDNNKKEVYYVTK